MALGGGKLPDNPHGVTVCNILLDYSRKHHAAVHIVATAIFSSDFCAMHGTLPAGVLNRCISPARLDAWLRRRGAVHRRLRRYACRPPR